MTRDNIFHVYALMKNLPINIRAMLKLTMRKIHRQRKYEGVQITKLCRQRGVPKNNMDYMEPLFTTLFNATKEKGSQIVHGSTPTTVQRPRRDDMITQCMYVFKMLCHKNGCRASSQEELDEVAVKYPLNEHSKVMLRL